MRLVESSRSSGVVSELGPAGDVCQIGSRYLTRAFAEFGQWRKQGEGWHSDQFNLVS